MSSIVCVNYFFVLFQQNCRETIDISQIFIYLFILRYATCALILLLITTSIAALILPILLIRIGFSHTQTILRVTRKLVAHDRKPK